MLDVERLVATGYFRDRFGLLGLSQASVQNRATCFEAKACCLLTAADAGPRIFPAMALAPDSHMLKNGFFFVHGFVTPKSPMRRSGALVNAVDHRKCRSRTG